MTTECATPEIKKGYFGLSPPPSPPKQRRAGLFRSSCPHACRKANASLTHNSIEARTPADVSGKTKEYYYRGITRQAFMALCAREPKPPKKDNPSLITREPKHTHTHTHTAQSK